MRSPPRAALGALAATGLLVATAGCGARWTSAQRQEVLARGKGTASGQTAGSPTSVPRSAVGPGASVPESTGPATGPAGGPVTAAGGSGDAGAAATGPSGPLPCSAPSTAPGVSADKITVGSINTLSGPVPGLGATADAAARSYVAYLNANGGVCGRRVELKTADDGADASQFRSILQSFEPSILGLIGEDGGGDAGGVDIVEANRIPVVTAAFSTAFQRASTVFDMNPPFADTSQSTAKYRWLHDQGVTKAALVYIAVDQSRDQIKNAEQPLLEAAGIQVVSDQALPLSTLSYDSAARAVANSGADYMLFLGGYEQNSNMAISTAGTGYHLEFAEYYTTYATKFVQQAGTAGEGATSWTYALPAEDGGANPEQAKFLQWLSQIAPGTAPDVFATSAWASSKAFFDAVQQLSGPISRDAVIAQLHTFTSYDADGFWGKVNLGDEINFGCLIGMKVIDGTWKRMVPDQGFLC